MTKITIDLTDLPSIADAIQNGWTTVKLLADLLEIGLEEGCLILPDSPWVASDCSGCEIEYHCETAREAAQRYVDSGDWPETNTTVWHHIRVWKWGVQFEGTLEQCFLRDITIQVDPDEPECVDGDHDWQSPYKILGGLEDNPGVWGHGGGIVSKKLCVKCGCGRTTDTWAQDPETGDQGLTSVEYFPGEYSEELSDTE